MNLWISYKFTWMSYFSSQHLFLEEPACCIHTDLVIFKLLSQIGKNKTVKAQRLIVQYNHNCDILETSFIYRYSLAFPPFPQWMLARGFIVLQILPCFFFPRQFSSTCSSLVWSQWSWCLITQECMHQTDRMMSTCCHMQFFTFSFSLLYIHYSESKCPDQSNFGTAQSIKMFNTFYFSSKRDTSKSLSFHFISVLVFKEQGVANEHTLVFKQCLKLAQFLFQNNSFPLDLRERK